MVQGVAAAQAGVSVIQPNVGRTREWYAKHPGVIRDPHGPREDSGFASRVDPGLQLVGRLYSYVKAHHPKTQVMASGIRTAAGEAVWGVGAGDRGWASRKESVGAGVGCSEEAGVPGAPVAGCLK
jgi:hypothetical protein